jgi:very-short-patch-repair endonuclease
MSPIEQKLWHALRGDQISMSFRRQHPVGPYVLDFYCASARLGIELDGDDHVMRGVRDANRTRFLKSRGICILRFTNREVWTNLDGVLASITIEIARR